MNRNMIIKTHLIATAIAIITISTFFISSLIAELGGSVEHIKAVKKGILYALPLMVVTMPMLAITGNKLAGNSKSPKVIEKQRRMKFITINGIILIFLAVFLYYQSHYQAVDSIFLIAQVAEFVFGLINLTLIGLNLIAGLKLSGRIRRPIYTPFWRGN